MAFATIATTLAHHAVQQDDPSRTVCGQPVADAVVREAHSEMVNCLACLELMPHAATQEQLVALGMRRVMRVQRSLRLSVKRPPSDSD